MPDPWILGFSLITVAVTIWMGFRSAKSSKSAADFFVAGRSVSVGWNASAISGEYLSAASFMGVAGMVMSAGYDALWYPVCYACGYLFLLLFIAGPLRRFGAYTIPDFAEGRYDSPIFRRIAVLFVLFIGFFYTMPQMKGAGTTLAYLFKDINFLGHQGLPYWVGVVVVGAVITLNVALGGMKGITLVQAFQYWIKMFAISVPIFVLASVYGGYGRQLDSINVPKQTDTLALQDAEMDALSMPFGETISFDPEAFPGEFAKETSVTSYGNLQGEAKAKAIRLGLSRTSLSLPSPTCPTSLALDAYVQLRLSFSDHFTNYIGRDVLRARILNLDTSQVPKPANAVRARTLSRYLERVFATNGLTLVHVSRDAAAIVLTTNLAKFHRAPGNLDAISHAESLPVATTIPYALPEANPEPPNLYVHEGGMQRGFSHWRNLWVDFRGRERRMMVTLPADTYGLPDLLLHYAQSHVWHRGVTRVSGLIAREISDRRIAYSQPGPLTRIEFDEHIRRVLADHGVTLVHVTSEVYKAVPTATAGNYGVAFREVPSGTARDTLPAKAPGDSAWLNPFGPLTTKAAKAAAAALPTNSARIEPVPLPEDASPRLVSWRNVPLAETLDVYQNLVGRTLLPRPNPTRDRLDDILGGQLSRLGLADRLKNYRGLVTANADGFNPDGTQRPIAAADLKTAIESAFQKAGITFVPVGDTFLRGVATTNLDLYAASLGKVSSQQWLARYERPYALLYTYSLIIALVCGTAGLPHILVRFYTNPDGVAAKRTTMWVMILIGIFYVFPPVFGVMGRNLMPSLYDGSGVNGTDGIVLKLPTVLGDRFGPLGSILSGITCAGAFAAFMSTFSGLLVSMTGALAHDVYGRILRPQSTPEQRLRMFKVAAVLIGAVAIGLGTLVENFEINFMVGQAFAIAAASYFPLLFMSVWWRGMTTRGAATGMLTGGLLAVAAISLTSWTTFITAQGAKFQSLGRGEPGWFTHLKAWSLTDFWAAHPLLRILCEQPAIWAVPLAILLMIVVSKRTRHQIPADIREKMLVLHAPEALGLKQDYIRDHHG